MFMQSLRVSLTLLAVFTVLLGLLYPGIVTGVSQAVFPDQADGSIIRNQDGKPTGSSLIGQSFSDPKYFWERPSATGPVPYNAAASSGSNLGAASNNLETSVKARIDALQKADPDNKASIPVDLVTASGSGLDPHISIAAAEYQAGRVARARSLSIEAVKEAIVANTENPQFGLLGETRVNVLRLNLQLDEISSE